MLRELLVLAAASGDFRDYERRPAQTILEDIVDRYSPEVGLKEEISKYLIVRQPYLCYPSP